MNNTINSQPVGMRGPLAILSAGRPSRPAGGMGLHLCLRLRTGVLMIFPPLSASASALAAFVSLSLMMFACLWRPHLHVSHPVELHSFNGGCSGFSGDADVSEKSTAPWGIPSGHSRSMIPIPVPRLISAAMLCVMPRLPHIKR